MVITSAIGGENVTTTVEGRERYPVNVRYLRDYRSTIDRLNRILVPTMTGAQIPMAQIADIKLLSGPGMIRDENGRLSGYVYVDVAGRDVGGYVEDAKKAVQDKVTLPAGYTLVWSGQYEYMQRVEGATAGGGADHAFHHLSAALLQHPLGGQDPDHLSRRALLGGGRHLASLSARLQHEHRRLGRA